MLAAPANESPSTSRELGEPSAGLPLAPASAAAGLRAETLARHLPAWEQGKAFTEEQQQAMAKFREALVADGLLTDWWDNTLIFARFCEAREFNVEKALTLFRSHLEWRKTFDLDVIVETAAGPLPKLLAEFRFPALPAVKQAVSFSHHKVSKQGFPMYYDRLGRMDLHALKESSSSRLHTVDPLSPL